MGEKPLGYPPGKRDRKILEKAWIIAFEALDIGDFEGFLREHERETQSEALQDIDKIALYQSEKQLIEKGKTAEAEGGLGLHESIIKDIQQQGLEYQAQGYKSLLNDYEQLKNELAAVKKRKSSEKQKAKQKPLVDSTVQTPALTPQPPTPKQEIPISMQFGEDFDRVREMIRVGGAKNLEDAKRLIADRNTRLTEADRFELAELLTIAEQGITPSKEPERIHAPAKTKGTISTTFNRRRREEEGAGVESYTPTHIELTRLDTRNAQKFLKKYQRQIPEMLRLGIISWLDKNPRAEKFPLTTKAIQTLVQQLEHHRIPIDYDHKPPGRELAGHDFITSMRYVLFNYGLDKAIEDYEWSRSYQKYGTQVDPETYKKIIITCVRQLLPEVYRFETEV